MQNSPSSADSSSADAAKTRRSPSPTAVAAFIAGALVFGAGAAAFGVRAAQASKSGDSQKAGVIAPGVKISGVPVGELSADAATEKMRAWAQTKLQTPISLTAPVSGRKWNLTLYQVGGKWDIASAVAKAETIGQNETWWTRFQHGGERGVYQVNVPVPFELKETLLDKQIAKIAKTVEHAPVNARARMGENGQLVLVSPETRGVKLNQAATKAALLAGGPEGLQNGSDAKLVIEEQAAKMTAADLGKVSSLLAAFHTDYGSSSDNRRHNIELAASHMDGTLLAPGEVFSYNAIVGPREPNLGWRNAPTYQDGQVVPGPGGGVCQTSTTLYNAVLRAGLDIVKRSHHSMPVHYVNPGCDATVAYDDIDFQFRNNTPGPVLVSARTKGGVLTFALFGMPDAVPGKIRIISGDQHGNASGGFTVSTYREITKADGTTERTRLSTDTYMPLIKRSTASVKPRPRTKPQTAPTTSSPAAPAEAAPAPLAEAATGGGA